MSTPSSTHTAQARRHNPCGASARTEMTSREEVDTSARADGNCRRRYASIYTSRLPSKHTTSASAVWYRAWSHVVVTSSMITQRRHTTLIFSPHRGENDATVGSDDEGVQPRTRRSHRSHINRSARTHATRGRRVGARPLMQRRLESSAERWLRHATRDRPTPNARRYASRSRLRTTLLKHQTVRRRWVCKS